jgi:two-component system response regulator RegX3
VSPTSYRILDVTPTAHNAAPHILVVDDDENLRRLVAAYLETEGYRVTQAADGRAALTAMHGETPHLVILDLMLPGLDGLQLAKQVRDEDGPPILMLTARGSEENMLQGFEAGADDYLVKPFSPKVLVARVKAILRRLGESTDENQAGPLKFGGLLVDWRSREVMADGRSVDLTATEFELLRVLSQHPGWVYSREELLEAVRGYSYLGDSRLVDVHIANLRKKIGDDPTEPRYIHTVRGAGYKFQPIRTDEVG